MTNWSEVAKKLSEGDIDGDGKAPSSDVEPAYYRRSGLQPVDVIDAFELGFNLGNAVKYILRAGRKTEDPRLDLKKALWYVQRQLDREEGAR